MGIAGRMFVNQLSRSMGGINTTESSAQTPEVKEEIITEKWGFKLGDTVKSGIVTDLCAKASFIKINGNIVFKDEL